MNTAFNRIEEMRREIIEIARKEAHNLFRLSQRAHDHGAEKTANEMQDEAWYLYNTIEAYPERLLEWKYSYNTKHAFRY